MGKTLLRTLKSLAFPDLQHRKRMLRREAWAAIVISYLALLAAWLVPGSFATASRAAVLWAWAMTLIRVLYVHMGLLLLVIAIIAALTRRYRMALVCLPLILLTVVWPCLNFGPRSPAESHGPTFRIISANLLMINENTPPILDEIEQSNADIVFLQEYTDLWDRAFQQRFATKYPHRITNIQEDSFGAAIYSRLPFVGPGRKSDEMGKWGIVQLTALVDVQGTIVMCRNIHLMPPRKLDYTIEHFDEMRDFVEQLANSTQKPVIVAGDFNFTGSTLQARAVEKAGFHDAFADAGTGRGSTWPVNGIFRYLPGIRLDHIFLSPALTCQNIHTGAGYGSDHRPLIARIAVVGPKP